MQNPEGKEVRGILEFFGRVKISLKMQDFGRFFGFFGFLKIEKIGSEMGTQFGTILTFWAFLENRDRKIVQKKGIFVHGCFLGPKIRWPEVSKIVVFAIFAALIQPLLLVFLTLWRPMRSGK